MNNKDIFYTTGKYSHYLVVTLSGVLEKEVATHSSILAWRIP